MGKICWFINMVMPLPMPTLVGVDTSLKRILAKRSNPLLRNRVGEFVNSPYYSFV